MFQRLWRRSETPKTCGDSRAVTLNLRVALVQCDVCDYGKSMSIVTSVVKSRYGNGDHQVLAICNPGCAGDTGLGLRAATSFSLIPHPLVMRHRGQEEV